MRNAVIGGAAVSAVLIAGGIALYARKDDDSLFGAEVTVPRAEVPLAGDDPHKVDEGKFYLIADDDGVLALYWRCTHLGCTVPWSASDQQFRCPCHGSVFDRHGVRISGPAPRPLDLMSLRFDPSGNAVVDTGQVTTRTEYSPDQAVQPPT
jgi:cytochrome b6-f complex iron-sulfur subunit